MLRKWDATQRLGGAGLGTNFLLPSPGANALPPCRWPPPENWKLAPPPELALGRAIRLGVILAQTVYYRGFCAPNRFWRWNLRPSVPPIPTPEFGLGRRIFPLETVWWGTETSAGICGHLLNFIGPQKLGIWIFENYFIIFMLFKAVILCF
jgi:hypothetical protein